MISIIEVLIGLAFLSNRFVKLASIAMIIHEILGTIYIMLTQGFDPRFPVLSLLGILALKNLILISAGLIVLADKNETITPEATPIKKP